MTVLIVVSSFWAEGTPVLALQLARYWSLQGLVVEILVLRSYPDDLRPDFEDLGLPIHQFALGQGLFRYFRLAWLTYHLSRVRKPSAVLSFPLGWHAPIALGAKLAGVSRVCAHVGNLPPVWNGIAFLKFKLLVQLGRPFTYCLLCCSRYIQLAAIRDFQVSAAETRAVYNACDLNQFTLLTRTLPPNRSKPLLGMVARLEGHKDQPTLIRAISILREQGVCVDLWLIGDGSRRPQIERLIRELGLKNHVLLLGSRRDIHNILSQLDLFVFSAKPDEGFGIALAEAMASGVPIVATDVGACREVLLDGLCGFLVEPGNPIAMANGIRRVLYDSSTTQEKVLQARKRALHDFSIDSMARAYALELGLADRVNP